MSRSYPILITALVLNTATYSQSELQLQIVLRQLVYFHVVLLFTATQQQSSTGCHFSCFKVCEKEKMR